MRASAGGLADVFVGWYDSINRRRMSDETRRSQGGIADAPRSRHVGKEGRPVILELLLGFFVCGAASGMGIVLSGIHSL